MHGMASLVVALHHTQYFTICPYIMATQAALTERTRAQAVLDKQLPALQRKVKVMGKRANIPALVMYQDSSHGAWHVTKHCPIDATFPSPSQLVSTHNLHVAGVLLTWTQLTADETPYAVKRTSSSTRKETEIARKYGASVRALAMRTAMRANVPLLVAHQDSVHGIWAAAKHCPDGMVFPDLKARARIYNHTVHALLTRF